jgi:long-chain acyl-CoA synthetase
MHTGDIASMDADGYVFIKGRKHDTINVGGFKVYPREVEDALLSHPDILEAAAFAAEHSYYGQVVQAWVVPRHGAAPNAQSLMEHCAAQLVRYKVPHAIGFAASLPKTSIGKLARRELRPIAPIAPVAPIAPDANQPLNT